VGTYISTTPQNFAGTITANDAAGGTYSITADGQSQAVTGITTSTSGIFSGSKPVTSVELGYTEYMSWGSWTQPLAMPASYDLFLDNPNYYINGTITPTLPMTGYYDYSGPAQGTLYSAAGGTVMSGGFTANVNFTATTSQITNYHVYVANGTNAALIDVPSLSISNNPSQPHFSATQSTGTWTLTVSGAPSPASTGKLSGSFFGANAENMGAVWSMSTPSGKAAGIAVGNYRAPAVP
jgi:hypothetical protein